MKAKEYTQKFHELGPNKTEEEIKKALSIVLIDFLEESSQLISSRKAQRSSAIGAIFKELQDKWRAFANQNKQYGIHSDGFKRFVINMEPQLMEYFGEEK